jgi:hypothetical protein
MKKFLFLVAMIFIVTINGQACEGDCVVCHPNLVKENGKLDKDHEILVTCKTCHTQEEMEKIDMGSGCGQDCWDCHDIKKVTASKVKEHNGLQTCIDCHLTIDKNIFGGATASAFSDLSTLDDLMNESSSNTSVDVNETMVIEEMNKTEISLEKKSLEISFWDTVLNFFKNLWTSIVSIFA